MSLPPVESLTIVVPTHQRPVALHRLLTSLSAQDLDREKFTICIVDNLTDTVTKKIVMKFQTTFGDRLIYSAVGALGVNRARNLGLSLARSPLGLFLDDDCVLPDPGYLQRVLTAHADHPQALAIGGRYLTPKGVGRWAAAYNELCNHWLTNGHPATQELLGGCVSYRLDRLRKMGEGFRDEIVYGGAETEFHARLRKSGAILQFDSTLSLYHHGSVSRHSLATKGYWQGYGRNWTGEVKGFAARRPTQWPLRAYYRFYQHFFALGQARLSGKLVHAPNRMDAFKYYGIYLLLESIPLTLRAQVFKFWQKFVIYLRWRFQNFAKNTVLLFGQIAHALKQSLHQRLRSAQRVILFTKGNYQPVVVLKRPQITDDDIDRLNGAKRLKIKVVEIHAQPTSSEFKQLEATLASLAMTSSYILETHSAKPEFIQNFTARLKVSEINSAPIDCRQWLTKVQAPLRLVLDTHIREDAAEDFFSHLPRREFALELEPDTSAWVSYLRLREFSALVKGFELRWLPYFPFSIHGPQLTARSFHSTRPSRRALEKTEVSIVIPHHGDPTNLEAVLQALSRQTLAPSRFEVIVIDNGPPCTLLSQSACEDLIATFPSLRLRLISAESPDGTLFLAGQARNLGLAEAQGEIIQFLDADILLTPGYLKDLIEQMTHSDVVMAKRNMLKPEFRIDEIPMEAITSENIYGEDGYWELFKASKQWTDLKDYWRYACTYCLAVKRDALTTSGPFDPSFTSYGFEDVDLAFRLFKTGARFAFARSWVYHLSPRKSAHNYHRDPFQRANSLRQSAFTLFCRRPEHLIYHLTQGYFAPRWHAPLWRLL